MQLSLFLLGAATTGVLAAPATSKYVLHERREALPGFWTEGTRLDGKVLLPIRVGLTQSNLDRGHDLLMEISDPNSPTYGNHLSAGDVHELFAPSEESVDSVRSWLESAGISPERISQSTNKQWLQFDATAAEAEELLQTEYYLYSHSGSGRSHVACRDYHVPESVQAHIDYIMPGIKLLELHRPQRSTETSAEKRLLGTLPPILRELPMPLAALTDLLFCDIAITPDCIQAMYNITEGTTATPGNELGIFESLGDVYSQEDLNLFFTTFAREVPYGTHPELRAINGAKAPTSILSAGPESNLDFQISYPLIWPQNSVLYQTDDPVYQSNYTFTGFLNNFLDAIDGSYCDEDSQLDPQYPNPNPTGYQGQKQCGVYKPTNVISISYGGAEASLPISYQRRQCQEWMKLGLQGVSIVVASGDSGVQSPAGSISPSGCLGAEGTVFTPDFPATCPYLTTAGATVLPRGGDANDPQEVAVKRFPSGGGFSNIYARPDYQKSAVEDYFSSTKVPYAYYESVNNNSFAANDGIYNRIGRGYPDISAVGDNIVVFTRGIPRLIGGTSASAPVFAAMLTRINEERLAAGKSTVGFVNPVLYQHPEVFRDVTEGSNPGCDTAGFPAAKGWDPVTGLGTPVYPALLKVFMDL